MPDCYYFLGQMQTMCHSIFLRKPAAGIKGDRCFAASSSVNAKTTVSLGFHQPRAEPSTILSFASPCLIGYFSTSQLWFRQCLSCCLRHFQNHAVIWSSYLFLSSLAPLKMDKLASCSEALPVSSFTPYSS